MLMTRYGTRTRKLFKKVVAARNLTMVDLTWAADAAGRGAMGTGGKAVLLLSKRLVSKNIHMRMVTAMVRDMTKDILPEDVKGLITEAVESVQRVVPPGAGDHRGSEPRRRLPRYRARRMEDSQDGASVLSAGRRGSTQGGTGEAPQGSRLNLIGRNRLAGIREGRWRIIQRVPWFDGAAALDCPFDL